VNITFIRTVFGSRARNFPREDKITGRILSQFYVHTSVHVFNLEEQQDAVLSSLYLFYFEVTLHVSGVSRTHHQEYISCSYNYWYKSKVWRM